MNKPLKLFISYSHASPDKDGVEQFRKHIKPLENNGLIVHWSDHKVNAGEDFQARIDDALAESDIVCLFISPNFLSSNACLEEKSTAVRLRKEKGVHVVPIILSDCAWKDDSDIAPLLALPHDGEPILSVSNQNAAWQDVYAGLKQIIDKDGMIQKLEITAEFQQFLHSAHLLANAHSSKTEVSLEKIFTYPKLTKFDDTGKEKIECASTILGHLHEYRKLLIAGENQSGKTSFCKILFLELKRKNYVPLYLSNNEDDGYRGKIENQLSKAFRKQYGTKVVMDEIDKDRLVLILDDFHYARKKEKIIESLSDYKYQIIFVDDIFGLNIKDRNQLGSFQRFKIEEYEPLQRNQLIRKWLEVPGKTVEDSNDENSDYKYIDEITEKVNAALGKNLGSGIMPSYPFFILSVITVSEAFSTPLDQEITSQGYCYQALIYIQLRKQNVNNDDMDTYFNFLAELAFHICDSQKQELSETELTRFLQFYERKFNLPVRREKLLSNLLKSHIIEKSNLNNYSFSYLYLYFFFVAKYLADNIETKKDAIKEILNNLERRDNAYIAAFLSHHSKSVYILDEISKVATALFSEHGVAELTTKELKFFDKKMDKIAQAALPNLIDSSPEAARDEVLRKQADAEKIDDSKDDTDDTSSDYESNIRKSVKTVEVMGTILKNRAGSLEKKQLKRIFREGVEIHFRILQSFLELIDDGSFEQNIVEYIAHQLLLISEKTGQDLDSEKSIKIAKVIFWNINFSVVHGVIEKAVHSLGSDKLTEIIKQFYADVDDNEVEANGTPAAFLVMCGSLMWHSKTLQTDVVKKRLAQPDFSTTAKEVLKHMVVQHFRLHKISYKEKQKIEALLSS